MKIIYYYHIPKCGGTSMSNLLKDLSGQMNGSFTVLNQPVKDVTFLTKIKNSRAVNKLFQNINTQNEDIKFIHHHHGYHGMVKMYSTIKKAKEEALRNGNEFYLFTVIREPISFQLSLINFVRNKLDAKHRSFDDYKEYRHQNVMYKYLLYNQYKQWPRKMNLDKKYFDKHCELFDQIFVLERLEEVYKWLQELTGINIDYVRKDNVSQHILQPTEAQLLDMKKANQLDQYFYDKYSS